MAFHTFLGYYTANEYASYKESALKKLATNGVGNSAFGTEGDNSAVTAASYKSDDSLEIIGAEEFEYPKSKRLNKVSIKDWTSHDVLHVRTLRALLLDSGDEHRVHLDSDGLQRGLLEHRHRHILLITATTIVGVVLFFELQYVKNGRRSYSDREENNVIYERETDNYNVGW